MGPSPGQKSIVVKLQSGERAQEQTEMGGSWLKST